MVQVLGQALEAGDSDGTKHGFDVLETLLYIVSSPKHAILFAKRQRHPANRSCSQQDVPYLTPHLAELVKFQLMAAGNKNYEDDARIMALNSLVWLIKL